MASTPSVDPSDADSVREPRDDPSSGFTARDVLDTAVGLGVLAYQRLQVQRREFERALRG